MADTYYQMMNTHWLKQCMENQESFYQQKLMTSSVVPQQYFYHSLQQGLNPTINMNYCQGPSMKMARSCTGSLSSSPLSDSHDSVSLTMNDMLSARDVNSSAFTKINNKESSSLQLIAAYNSPAAIPDQPMDLSKPKNNTILQHPAQPGSRLANLLGHKRKAISMSGYEVNQSGPLNLSKKTLLPSTITHNFLKENSIVDMNDAVKNPVQLVKLVHQSQTAGEITRFMNQMLCKVFALKPFNDLHESDRTSLVLNCWHRLLLWIYAENKFTFQVMQLTENEKQLQEKVKHKKSAHVNQPSMAFVNSIATFLKKYETLQVESEEMNLLFAITLFHSTGDGAYEEPEKIANHRRLLLSQLQSHVKNRHMKTGGDKRYTDLLMYLPLLYGVNGKMVEELFCQHLSSEGDIKITLKETIKTYTKSSAQPN